MTNLVIQVPDDLARSLEGIAAAQHKTVQEFAVERLRAMVEGIEAGTPAAVLRAMSEPPHLSASDVAALEAAIAAGKQPVRSSDIFAGEES